MSNIDQIRALMYGIQFSDPRLFELLRLMAEEIETVNNELFPIVSVGSSQTSTAPVYVTPMGYVTYSLQSTYIGLSWDKPGNDAFSYEIRLGGADWEHAERLVITQSLSVKLSPVAAGTQVFRFKVINYTGDYSAEQLCFVIIPAVGAVTITPQVIDNNVLLYWTAPTSTFLISHYDVYRDGVFFGNISGTFFTIFETVAGTYTYKIVPVDIADNEGTEATVSLLINQPPDFILADEHIANLTTAPATVTLTNVVLGNDRLLACVDPTDTWQDKFAGRPTFQDRIDDGYPRYIQPGTTTGSYIEKVDFGAIVTNLIATVDYNYRDIEGTVAITVSIEYSDDDSTWSGYTAGKQLFIPSLRYLRVKLEFAGAATELVEITNLRYTLNVKQQVDSGTVDVLASDAAGTVVTFNLAFKDVNSITLTALSTQPIYCIYDFVDAPNPTSFKILAFDSSGNRVDKTVSWQAKGVV